MVRTSDPRDKIYSALGLFQTYLGIGILDPLPVGLVIDYGAPIQVVYSTFMKRVVESTKRLDIFVFWSGPYSKHVQLSWCPDWSITPRNRYHYGQLGIEIEIGDSNYQGNFSFDANPGSSCQAIFAKSLDTMTMLGIVWDVVYKLPVPFAEQYKLDEIIEDYSKWSQFTAEATQMGCQRLIASTREEIMPEPSSAFYAKLLEALMCNAHFGHDPEETLSGWNQSISISSKSSSLTSHY